MKSSETEYVKKLEDENLVLVLKPKLLEENIKKIREYYGRVKKIKIDNYSDIYNFHEGMAIVRKDGKFGFINKEGEETISCIYDFADYFCEGLAVVRKNGKYGYINSEGKVVIPCTYDFARDFHEGLAVVHENREYGYINQKGEEIIPLIYDFARDFHEGLGAVCKNGKYVYINKEGKKINYKLGSAYPFYEGLAVVRKGGDIIGRGAKYGYINSEGKIVIPCTYDFACDFYEGLGTVIFMDGKYGYINKEGKEIIIFRKHNDAHNNRFNISNNNINYPIETLIDFIYDLTDYYIGLYYDLSEDRIISFDLTTNITKNHKKKILKK